MTFEPTPEKAAIQFYTPDKADQIAELHALGKSLTEIFQMSEMPHPKTYWQWMQSHPEFKKKMTEAKAMKAQWHEEQALLAAERAVGAKGDNDAAAERLRFDAHKWAAEISDPATYGKKAAHSGEGTGPMTFIIATGFPDLTPEQRQPRLGKDGLIEKEVTSNSAQPDADSLPS